MSHEKYISDILQYIPSASNISSINVKQLVDGEIVNMPKTFAHKLTIIDIGREFSSTKGWNWRR
jgi:hypothetical protein